MNEEKAQKTSASKIHNPQPKTQNQYELIVIGASLGGLNALQSLFRKLGKTFVVPIAVVLHRQEIEHSDLVYLLQKFARQGIVEAEDKMKIEKGMIYIAPGGYHLLVNGDHFQVSIDEQIHYARPSIDVLFDSAAFSKREKLIGILLTGSGNDGIWGMQQVQSRGGRTIIQSPESAECKVLPEEALESLVPDDVLSIEEIGSYLNRL